MANNIDKDSNHAFYAPCNRDNLLPFRGDLLNLFNEFIVGEDQDFGYKLTLIFDNHPWLLDTRIEPMDNMVKMLDILDRVV